MQILSALDAISPAFSRTKLVLFTPFRKGRTWKLAATGYLAVGGTAFLPLPLLYLLFLPMVREAGGAMVAMVLTVVSVVMTLIFVYLFYVFSRLRFVFFDIVLNRGEFVAPAWRKYGPQAFKWSVFKVVLGTLATAVFALPSAAFIRHFISVITALKPGEQPPPELMFSMMTGYFAVYFGFGLFFFFSSLLGDFIVPSLALEDTTLTVAFQRLGKLMRAEPAQFALYSALKLGLGFAVYFGVALAFEIVIVVVLVVVGAIAFGVGLLLHMAGVPMIVLYVLAGLVGLALYVFLFFYGGMLIAGAVMTFLESYNLYFLGGRYPMLGELLERSTPPKAVPALPPGYAPYNYPPPAGMA